MKGTQILKEKIFGRIFQYYINITFKIKDEMIEKHVKLKVFL